MSNGRKLNLFIFDLAQHGELTNLVLWQVAKMFEMRCGICVASYSWCAPLKKEKFIPLFLCNSYDEIRAHGFNVPREFVFEVGLNPNPDYIDDPDTQPEMLCEILGDSIKERLKLYKELGIRVTLADVRDWCVGAFRRYLFMDDDVHGTSGTFSISELIKGDKVDGEYWGKWFGESGDDENKFNREMLRARFGVGVENPSGRNSQAKPPAEVNPKEDDPLRNYKNVLSVVFGEEFRRVKENVIEKPGDNYQEVKDFFEKRLPCQQGLALKFVSPSGKIRVLVVDDNAKSEEENLKGQKSLSDIFHFTSLELKKGDDESSNQFIKRFIGEIKNKSKECVDVILLDLSLGESAGSDLTGYHLIKRFKQWMPTAYIIIYSEHEDMGHIVRAFREGADWFLKKSEAREKLARHFISLMANRKWRKEFGVIRPKYVLDIKGKDENFIAKFNVKDVWQYLTIKSLELLPGHYIKINKMGGGISSAVTFRAQKGITRDTEDNQAPVIIKIDSVFNTRMEYERYFRFIRPYIANESGRIEKREIVLNRDSAAIVYTFAGRRDAAHELNTLDELLRRDMLSRETCDYEKYRKMFNALFDEITTRLHRVTPVAEFRDLKTDPVALSEFSDYPNRTFGELESDSISSSDQGHKSWFFSNFTYRMPIESVVEKFAISEDSSNPNEVYEVYGIQKADLGKNSAKYPYTYIIECQRYKIKNDKNDKNELHKKVLLKGDLASYYARFRKYLLPGMLLSIKLGEGQTLNENELMSWCFCFCANKNLYQIRAEKTEDGSKQEGCFRISKKLYNKMAGWFKDKENLITVRDALKKLVDEEPHRFVCPVGIVHGDLNLKNIMIESRINPPKEIQADITKVLSDVWLIDFARTRRDVVAHDFNVAFTSVLPLLFQPDLVGTHEKDKPFEQNDEQKKYVEELDEKLEPYLRHILIDKYDTLSDLFAEDQRLVFMYKILRRIRKAALATGMSEDMYLLTTALTCLYSFKLYLKQGMPEAATALVMAGLLCVEKLNPSDNYFEASKTTAL